MCPRNRECCVYTKETNEERACSLVILQAIEQKHVAQQSAPLGAEGAAAPR